MSAAPVPRWLEGLTERQLEAAGAGDRNLLVTAGAGTGKTSVLAARYLHLHLGRGVPIRRILAITFTEKAAAEMRERIAERLQELGEAASLREIPHAPIFTIDSLCYRIVKEYGEAAGLEPECAVLDPVDAEELEEEVWVRLLDRWWSGSREEALRLFRAFPWKVGAKHPGGIDPWPLRSLLRSIRTAGQNVEEVPFVPDLAAERSAIARSVEDLLPEIERLRRSKVTDKTAEKLGAILSLRGVSPDERSAAYARVRGAIDKVVSREAKPAVGRAIDLLEAWTAVDAEGRLEDARRLLGRLARDFHRTFAEEKAKRGVVDFLDLEEGALRLLEEGPVAREVRSRYSYLLLDECQDTNELQLRIVDRLRNEGRLLAVGDAKQSIYAFRDADVTAFLAMSESFGGGAGPVVLGENFRSRREILDYVNALLPKLWDENRDMHVPYDVLAPSEKKKFAPKEVPSVEVLIVRGTTTERLREREAELLAKRLRAIHREKLDGLAYGDMAVLFRSTTDLQTYEHALRARGIPTAVAVGRGFFQTREVVDLLDALSLVDDPTEDLVLAGVLRSPLAGLSDPDLAELFARRAKDDPPLWDRIREGDLPPSLSAEGASRLARFAEMLARLRSLRGRVRASRLLEELVRETRYVESHLLLAEGLRYRANIRKLLELAREQGARANRPLAETIRALRRFRYTRTREAESALDVERDAVRLLTIHGAKGMQFPLVAVVDLGRKAPGRRPDLLFDKKRGVGVKERTEGGVKKPVPRLYAEIEKEQRLRAEAEEVRLLYVALTRAERHLILSGCRTEKAEGWLARIERALPIPEEPGIHRIEEAFVRVLEAAAPEEVERRPISPARVVAAPARYGARADAKEAEKIARRLMAEPPAPEPAEEGRTVTGVAAFTSCPRRFDLARRFPIPEPASGAGGSASRAGTAFHERMEAHWKGLAARGSRPSVAGGAGAGGAGGEPAPGEHIAWMSTLLAHPEMRRVHEAGRLGAEVSFAVAVGGRPLRGVVDLLAIGKPGALVVDYKTDRASPEEIAARYRVSANLYRIAIERLFPNALPVDVLLYAARAGELVPVPADDAGALAALAAYDRAEAARRYDARENEHCPFCRYRRGCPAFRAPGAPPPPGAEGGIDRTKRAEAE